MCLWLPFLVSLSFRFGLYQIDPTNVVFCVEIGNPCLGIQAGAIFATGRRCGLFARDSVLKKRSGWMIAETNLSGR